MGLKRDLTDSESLLGECSRGAVWDGIIKDVLVGLFLVKNGTKINSQTYMPIFRRHFLLVVKESVITHHPPTPPPRPQPTHKHKRPNNIQNFKNPFFLRGKESVIPPPPPPRPKILNVLLQIVNRVAGNVENKRCK